MDGEARLRDPLSGITVLELASWLAGPFTGCLLADFGADVIKVERPGSGDEGRTLGGATEADPTRSPWWVTFSRGKRSITLDPSTSAGREVLLDLVRRVDAVTESFRPGTLEKWGLGWDQLQQVNPGLVLLRISGFGQDGPLSSRRGFDRVAQAFGGFMYVTGEPACPPTKAGVSIVDYSTGLWGAFGVLLALQARAVNGGRGQVVDQALYDSMVAYLGDQPYDYVRHGTIRERSGSRHPKVSPGGVYRSGDGHWFQVSATSQATFERMVTALGLQEMLADPRYATNALRVQYRQPLDDLLQQRMDELGDQELIDAFERHEVAYSPVQNIQQLYEHPHIKARRDFMTIDDPLLGPIPAAKITPRLTLTPGGVRSTAPRLGEHNDEVYRGVLGYSAEKLAALAGAGII
jgi:crotonobetainyl-CoA:carnitine CoA-transferase CaiB-like acyl-CoA transferase